MSYKICYIGNDEKYWESLVAGYRSQYDDLVRETNRYAVDDNFEPYSMFWKILDDQYSVLYIDFNSECKKLMLLAKLLCRNNETRKVSLVGLFSEQEGPEKIVRAINASVRLNYYKGIELEDAIYGPMSLLNVNQAINPEYIRGEALGEFELKQLLRVGYIEQNYFRVETNSYLEEGDILEVDTHPLVDLMPSKKLYVEKFFDNDLYYNRRFAYHLEFIYLDNDFFSLTNKNWQLYKKFKDDPMGFAQYQSEDKEQIKEDMETRKKNFGPTKLAIDTWIEENRYKTVPKKLKVMVVDRSGAFIQDMSQRTEPFTYSLNMQTVLTDDLYQIQRTMPHLLVFHFEPKVNNLDMLGKIFKKIKSLKDYEPYVLVLGIDKENQSHSVFYNYKQVLTYAQKVSICDVENMAKILDEKKHISDAMTKVFLESSDPHSTIFLKRTVDVIAATESIIYFKTDIEVPMWTVFRVDAPVSMLITVVPHKEDGEFKGEENCYRALINAIGEQDKAALRRLINISLEESDDEEPKTEEGS